MDTEYATALHARSEHLAGHISDAARRARIYHHIYRHAHGNHVFPLLASHGSLWAAGFLQRGLLAGRILAWCAGSGRRRRLASLMAFANAFCRVNRHVCVESFYVYHLTASARGIRIAETFMPADLLEHMLRCHFASRRRIHLGLAERRALYQAFFHWEQDVLVDPAITEAYRTFDWPLIRWIAQRPNVALSFLPWTKRLWFRDLSQKAERVEKGLRAFEIGEHVGWDIVEAKLQTYAALPRNYLQRLDADFKSLGLEPV